MIVTDQQRISTVSDGQGAWPDAHASWPTMPEVRGRPFWKDPERRPGWSRPAGAGCRPAWLKLPGEHPDAADPVNKRRPRHPGIVGAIAKSADDIGRQGPPKLRVRRPLGVRHARYCHRAWRIGCFLQPPPALDQLAAVALIVPPRRRPSMMRVISGTACRVPARAAFSPSW